ncbi:MAG: exonuclease subunit SbcD [bacterium]
MRILHTSDWHLGQKLCNLERFAEHDFFLEHLLQLIREQQVDCLLHAGDIFDTANPPNQALRQYFNFLRRLHEETNCRQAILVGGNHDSVLTLQAPQRLLEVLQVHVVGGLPADPAEQLIPIQGADGEEALVCAVPFLRDADLRNILPGESYEARQQRLREGIATHYQKLAQLAAPWKQRGQFVCATGHLFVATGQSSDSEKEIHIGLQDRFPVADFPDFFDYLALGHLHRPQRVAGMNHVRYSGSPLPLSFSERQDSKSVLLLEVEKGTLQQVRELPLPIPRRLLRLQGTVEEVCEKLQALEEPAGDFEDWVEARVQLEAPEPDLIASYRRSPKPSLDSICSRCARSTHARQVDWRNKRLSRIWKTCSPEKSFKSCACLMNWQRTKPSVSSALLESCWSAMRRQRANENSAPAPSECARLAQPVDDSIRSISTL